ncbi:MAG: hypothetical protein AAB614_01845 [Patescibacteria group bacterium]
MKIQTMSKALGNVGDIQVKISPHAQDVSEVFTNAILEGFEKGFERQEWEKHAEEVIDVLGVVKSRTGICKVFVPEKKFYRKNRRVVRESGEVLFEVFRADNDRNIFLIKPMDFSGVFDFLKEDSHEWHVTIGNAIFGKISHYFPNRYRKNAMRFVRLLNEVFYPVYITNKTNRKK